MKISQHPELPPSSNSAGANSPAKTAQQTAVRDASAGDVTKGVRSAGVAVTVSALARTMEKPLVSNSSVFDSAKVTAVKSAIQNGTYTVNPEAIADKLLSNTQDVIKRISN